MRLEPAALLRYGGQPGGLRKTAPIVTWIRLVCRNELVRCQALVDGGSESSYFHPGLQNFAISTRQQSFKL